MKNIILFTMIIALSTPALAEDVSANTSKNYVGGQSKKATATKRKAPAKRTSKKATPTRARKRAAPKRTNSVDMRAYNRYESKAELARALELAKNKNYVEASRQLFDLSRNPKYRAERDQIRYILGLMLYDMGLYQSAGYQFVSVVRQVGSRYTDKALEKLSAAADILNDRTLLNYSMSKVNLDRFPREQRDMLRFRVGEYQFQNKQYDKAAHNFSRVARTSPYYSKAKYMEGLAQAEQNQLQDALSSFSALKAARSESGVTDKNRVAAMMGMARIYYQNRSWDRAIEAYQEIPRDSHMWHDAVFELSWAQMRAAKLRSVLSNFQTLHSPYYEDAYIPESLLLRGIVYLYICQYDEMGKTLDLYGNIYGRVSNQLKKFLATRPRSEQYYQELRKIFDNFKLYDESPSERDKLAIPFIVGNKVFQEGDVQSTQDYIDMLRKEQEILDRLPNDWKRSAVGTSSIKLVNRRINAAQKRAGLQIKKHLIDINRDLDRLTEQADFARYEMLNAKKEGIKKSIGLASSEKTLDASMDREFYIQNGYEYWPFQGEYWLDELGNYHYLGTQSCE